MSDAQQEVKSKEANFLSARSRVQDLKVELTGKEDALSETRKTVDRTDRSNEKYLQLVAKEHEALLAGIGIFPKNIHYIKQLF